MGCEPEPTIPRPSLLSCFFSCLHLEAWAILSGPKDQSNKVNPRSRVNHNEIHCLVLYISGTDFIYLEGSGGF